MKKAEKQTKTQVRSVGISRGSGEAAWELSVGEQRQDGAPDLTV